MASPSSLIPDAPPGAPPALKPKPQTAGTFLNADSFEDAVRALVDQYKSRSVRIKKQILQGSNASYTAAHSQFGSQFKFDRDGLCDAMCMEFIRLGLTGANGHSQFRSLIDGNWAYLGLLQSTFTSFKKDAAKSLFDLNDKLAKATEQHRQNMRAFESASSLGKMFGSMGLGSVPSSEVYQKSLEKMVERDKLIDEEYDRVQQKLRDLQANTVYNSQDPAVLARRQDIFKEVSLVNLAPELIAAFDKPAFYYLLLSGGGKHAMAFEITMSGQNHRFMDPNGFELEIGSRGFLRPFLVDYFSIYLSPKWGSLQQAECTLVRFS